MAELRYTGTYMPCSWAASERRKKENFFETYCTGKGIDIGAGCDPVIKGVEQWDRDQGDATYMEGVPDESYDFVYSSHCLEHIVEADVALKNWWRLVKPGGYLILLLPHRNLYEQKRALPSAYNGEHVHMFLLDRDESPDTIGIVPFIGKTLDNCDMIYAKKCNSEVQVDDKVEPEFSIEVVLRKIHPDDWQNYLYNEGKECS